MLEDHMQEIKDKKKLLQNEINRLQSEMNNFKAQITNEPLHAVNPKALSQKVHAKNYLIGHVFKNVVGRV